VVKDVLLVVFVVSYFLIV